MKLRLIHGTIAILGDRAAISDLAILSELALGFFLLLFSLSYTDQNHPESFDLLGRSSPTFLFASNLVDYGLVFLVAGFVFGIARGDRITGARTLLSMAGGIACLCVPVVRLIGFAGLYYAETGNGGHSKLAVMTAAELALGLIFMLDLVRGLYYTRSELRFRHMVFHNFILSIITLPSLAILFEIWYFEHPVELIHSASLLANRLIAANMTTGPPPFVRDPDEVHAVFVMAATPAQALANLCLIGGHFLGDHSPVADGVFVLAGGAAQSAVGAIFLREAMDERYAHRAARTTLAGLISLVVGAAHLLASAMFLVMREEVIAVRAGANFALPGGRGRISDEEVDSHGVDHLKNPPSKAN